MKPILALFLFFGHAESIIHCDFKDKQNPHGHLAPFKDSVLMRDGHRLCWYHVVINKDGHYVCPIDGSEGKR